MILPIAKSAMKVKASPQMPIRIVRFLPSLAPMKPAGIAKIRKESAKNPSLQRLGNPQTKRI